MEQLAHRR